MLRSHTLDVTGDDPTKSVSDAALELIPLLAPAEGLSGTIINPEAVTVFWTDTPSARLARWAETPCTERSYTVVQQTDEKGRAIDLWSVKLLDSLTEVARAICWGRSEAIITALAQAEGIGTDD